MELSVKQLLLLLKLYLGRNMDTSDEASWLDLCVLHKRGFIKNMLALQTKRNINGFYLKKVITTDGVKFVSLLKNLTYPSTDIGQYIVLLEVYLGAKISVMENVEQVVGDLYLSDYLDYDYTSREGGRGAPMFCFKVTVSGMQLINVMKQISSLI